MWTIMALVLIADDSSLFRTAYARILTGAGHNIIMVEDGYECLLAAKDHQPDLILMDVVMPTLNGFQATRQLSKHNDTNHIPVVLTSTKNTEPDRVWAMRQGAAAYLVKPAKCNATSCTELLLNTINKLLPRKHFSPARDNQQLGL